MAAVQEICDRTALATGSGLGELAVRHFGRAGRVILAVLLGALITALLVLGSFARIALVFKVLCAALLSYLVVAVPVTRQWGSVLSHTLIPHIELNKAYLVLLVAVLGTTISHGKPAAGTIGALALGAVPGRPRLAPRLTGHPPAGAASDCSSSATCRISRCDSPTARSSSSEACSSVISALSAPGNACRISSSLR